MLTYTQTADSLTPARANSRAGFGDPLGVVKATLSSSVAFFMPVHVLYGRAGRESRKALPVLHRFANPLSPLSRLATGSGSTTELEHIA